VPGAFRLIARIGPRVEKSRHASLEEAVAAVEARVGVTGRRQHRREVLGRTYDPDEQVTGRFELRGPGRVRGGVDVRGDGTAQAYRGWLRKEPIDPLPGETAGDALRRALQR
jgi:hypothetical protein